ncbi:MAG: hypothetical protein ACSHXH_14890 [Marivita sp.]|uniref:hypothetical protein n=1 Tax=Marivita sp. TaxID=2003365 RepID=UPI003EF09A50
MTRSIFRLRNLQISAGSLHARLVSAIDHCRREGCETDFPATDLMFQLQETHREFEAVLKSELGNLDLYLVQQKSAFDTRTLIEAGELAFPLELKEKVPDAIFDLKEAMKCIAFELPTAAAFHLHRANEIVLATYWDQIMNGKARPKSMGNYIAQLEKVDGCNQQVLAALKDIKNLYRNPTIHAEQNFASAEQAVDLLGVVRSAISAMMNEITLD